MVTERFEMEELSGDRYPSLEEGQRAALPHLAELLASILRQGIEDGRFVVVDGVVMLAPKCESGGTATRGCTNAENDV